jgi:DNA integrity scanning protein DisA with diadenylate cyclase activity
VNQIYALPETGSEKLLSLVRAISDMNEQKLAIILDYLKTRELETKSVQQPIPSQYVK